GKDVCAFANARGGALIFGIREENGTARELVPIEFSQSKEQQLRSCCSFDWLNSARELVPIEFSQSKEQQLRSWAHGRVFPSPEIEVQRLPAPADPNSGCLLVIVARSGRQPHAVLKERDSGLRYVVRVGRDTRTLTESEVAERYGRRFETAKTRIERLDAVSRTRTKLRAEESYCWITLALVPEIAGR